jgi:hypothetical protein
VATSFLISWEPPPPARQILSFSTISLSSIESLFVWLVADVWYWFVLREKYCGLVADGWFVLREKYCWLVVDKPNEQGANHGHELTQWSC